IAYGSIDSKPLIDILANEESKEFECHFTGKGTIVTSSSIVDVLG
ncbi:2976_t:CDS:1, partial [Funneliformis caledonium]